MAQSTAQGRNLTKPHPRTHNARKYRMKYLLIAALLCSLLAVSVRGSKELDGSTDAGPSANAVNEDPPDTFFSTGYMCYAAKLTACYVTKQSELYYSDCPLAILPLGPFEIREPSIVLICVIAGLTAAVSSVKIFRNRDAEGHVEYALVFGFFSIAILLVMGVRSFVYTPSGFNSFVVAVAMFLMVFLHLSLFFCGIVDAGLMPKSLIIRGVIYAIVYGIVGVALLISISVNSSGSVFTFYFALPVICVVVFFTCEVVFCARYRHFEGFAYLCATAAAYALGLCCLFLFNGPLCSVLTANFDGVFFYFVSMDVVMCVIYKYYVIIRADELDDEEMVDNARCF